LFSTVHRKSAEQVSQNPVFTALIYMRALFFVLSRKQENVMTYSTSPKGVFRNDPKIQSRHYQERQERRFVGGNTGEFWTKLAARVQCPACQAQPETPCISSAKATPGAELAGYHSQRVTEAKRQFGANRPVGAPSA
jgi:hypothetical protein